MAEYTPKVPTPEYAAKPADDLAVPATRRDVLEVLGLFAEESKSPDVRRVCAEIWEEFTVIWRHGPPQHPPT